MPDFGLNLGQIRPNFSLILGLKSARILTVRPLPMLLDPGPRSPGSPMEWDCEWDSDGHEYKQCKQKTKISGNPPNKIQFFFGVHSWKPQGVLFLGPIFGIFLPIWGLNNIIFRWCEKSQKSEFQFFCAQK